MLAAETKLTMRRSLTDTVSRSTTTVPTPSGLKYRARSSTWVDLARTSDSVAFWRDRNADPAVTFEAARNVRCSQSADLTGQPSSPR